MSSTRGKALAMMIAMMEINNISGEISMLKNSEGNKKPINNTPFNKQEGVLKMVEDYNLIKKGISKKGKVKQLRILKRVDEWLELGHLSLEDLQTQ